MLNCDIRLTGTDLSTSRVGLGCASLHHLFRQENRLAILETALDVGIRHFDCARMYGHGLAERTLGLLAKRRRSNMVIATKFGIAPNAVLEKYHFLQYPAKASGMLLRKMGFRRSVQYLRHRFSELEAEENLQASLTAMQTDYIDVLLLHEPQLVEADQILALGDWADKKRRAGVVRYFGLAGEHAEAVARGVDGTPWAEIVQSPFRGGNTKSHADFENSPQIVFGITRALVDNTPEAMRSRQSYSEMLHSALVENSQRVVLISSTKVEHVKAAAHSMLTASAEISNSRVLA